MSRDEFLTFTTPTPSPPSPSVPSSHHLPRAPAVVRTSALPRDFGVLVTDTLESPATFLLTYFIGRAVRDGRRTVVVGVAQGLEHYTGILRKNGVQLPSERQKGLFDFVPVVDAAQPLRTVFESISTCFESAVLRAREDALPPLLVLDDLSSLLWSGHEARDVAALFAGVRAMVAKASASLVVLLHVDDIPNVAHGSDDTYLFRRVLQLSDLWLRTTSLGSQTRGELSIYRGPALVEDYGVIDRSGPTALLYKLDETGPTYSQKGLARFM